jgi:phage gp46-like protein
MSSQQGDVKLSQTVDGGDISVVNGVIEMSGGLETSVYLALFGGNEDDDGSDKNIFSWWGNKEDMPENQYHSKTQFLLKSLPATSNNLLLIEDAVILDTKYLIELKIASSVNVEVSIPKINAINIKIIIEADGVETEFNFTENWKIEVK